VEHLQEFRIVLRFVVVLDGLHDSTLKFVLSVLDFVDIAESTVVVELTDYDPVPEPLLRRSSRLLSGGHGDILSANPDYF
jgi:hypothetical protein